MFILAAAIVGSLAALHQAQRVDSAAVELRQARALTKVVLDSYRPLGPGRIAGRSGALDWQLDVSTPAGIGSGTALCVHQVTISSSASRRRYAARTAEFCPGDLSS